ncbi:MAG: D-hexose-6-phosphate mutarotase [Lentisphaeria bacterium]|nr:D-hexose-6-phosphate mutarotase [Lentisphaeria bacterium]
MTLAGAHVAEYAPAGQEEVLFMSGHSEYVSGKAIRGGVPVCFPWFGAPPEGRIGSHGWARVSDWELLAADSGRAVFGLTREGYRLRYTVMPGAKLEMRLEVENISGCEVTFSGALHTYLRVGDVERAEIFGLEGVTYRDALTGERRIQTGPVIIDREVDRAYISDAEVTVLDPVLDRRIVVAKSGSGTTMVWNPWIAKAHRMPDFGDEEYRDMLCIEAALVPAVGDQRILAPGEKSTLSQTVAVAPLN